MKKLLAVLLCVAMLFAFTACGGNDAETTDYKVAMITDYGDITDESFNQTTYEACKAFCEENSLEFNYFKPAGDNTADRVSMIDSAVSEGYNVIVMPGYAFGGAIVEAAPNYPDVKFIALDVAKGDLLEAAVAAKGEKYDYNPDNWELADYFDMSNVYCVVYQEELAGYMAGYAAVKLGYKKLGFLGGMAVPAVMRYGYGFVQGAEAAATEMNVADLELKYHYTGGFDATPEVQSMAASWYQSGTEVIFGCGGGVGNSVMSAAEAAGAKVIGVDVDQSPESDTVITSAMKQLSISVNDIIGDYYEGTFQGGKTLVMDVTTQGVGLPMDTSKFTKFTQADYDAIYAKLVSGEIKTLTDKDVQSAAELPATHVAVEVIE